MSTVTRAFHALGVIAGLDPAIQGAGLGMDCPWMPGSSPGMTWEKE